MVFIDADAFIAWNHGLDSNHTKAVAIFTKLEKTSEKLVTSWDVVDEVATKLSQFLTRHIALSFLDNLLNSTIEIKYVDPLLKQQAIQLFRRQTSKHVSLTDCVNIVICRQLGIKQIFSFDRHYPQNSLRLFS